MNRIIPSAVFFFGLVPSLVSAADTPIEVRAAIRLDQVTDVNQKAENFSIVSTLLMGWKDRPSPS